MGAVRDLIAGLAIDWLTVGCWIAIVVAFGWSVLRGGIRMLIEHRRARARHFQGLVPRPRDDVDGDRRTTA